MTLLQVQNKLQHKQTLQIRQTTATSPHVLYTTSKAFRILGIIKQRSARSLHAQYTVTYTNLY